MFQCLPFLCQEWMNEWNVTGSDGFCMWGWWRVTTLIILSLMTENMKSAACQLQSLIAIIRLVHFTNACTCTHAHMCMHMYIWTKIHMANKPLVTGAIDVLMKWKWNEKFMISCLCKLLPWQCALWLSMSILWECRIVRKLIVFL